MIQRRHHTAGKSSAWLALACLALFLFRVTFAIATSIEVRTNGGSSTGGVTELLSRDGIQLGGTQNTTKTGPIVIDLASTVTFNTLTSDPAQPITFNSSTGTVIVTSGQTFTADTLTPTTANTTLSLSGTGTGGVNIAGLVNINQAIASSVIVHDLTDVNATFNGSIIFSTGSSIIGVGSVLFQTATIQTLNTTDVTATHVWTNQIGPRTTGAVFVNATAGLAIARDDGSSSSTFTASANTLTIDVNGANGTLALASGDTFTADSATITTLTATTGAVTTLTTTNATATDLYVNTIHARNGTTVTIDSADDLLVNAIKGNPAGIELKATSGILMELNAGTFPSTWTPASGQLTLNVNANGKFVLDSTDYFVATLSQIVTMNATSTISDNVTTTNLWTNVIGRRVSGVTEIRNTTGLALELDDGTVASTVTPSAGKLTLDVNSSGGILQLASGDSISGDMANLTTVNVTTLQNATTISGTNHNGSLANLTTVNVTTLQNATLVRSTNVSATSLEFANDLNGNGTDGDILYRLNGKYRRLQVGTPGQGLMVDTVAPTLTWGSPTANPTFTRIWTNIIGRQTTGPLQLNFTDGVSITNDAGTNTSGGLFKPNNGGLELWPGTVGNTGLYVDKISAVTSSQALQLSGSGNASITALSEINLFAQAGVDPTNERNISYDSTNQIAQAKYAVGRVALAGTFFTTTTTVTQTGALTDSAFTNTQFSLPANIFQASSGSKALQIDFCFWGYYTTDGTSGTYAMAIAKGSTKLCTASGGPNINIAQQPFCFRGTIECISTSTTDVFCEEDMGATTFANTFFKYGYQRTTSISTASENLQCLMTTSHNPSSICITAGYYRIH